MTTHSPGHRWARLAAVACTTTLATGLAASVVVQPYRGVPARAAAAREAADARLDAHLDRAISQAYLAGDYDLADSHERIRATRAAAAHCPHLHPLVP
jgi:hypothetical protein